MFGNIYDIFGKDKFCRNNRRGIGNAGFIENSLILDMYEILDHEANQKQSPHGLVTASP